MANSNTGSADKVSLSADIVAAYVSRNSVPPRWSACFDRVGSLGSHGPWCWGAVPRADVPVPAVPIWKSITPGFLIRLDDGRKFKSLKTASRRPTE